MINPSFISLGNKTYIQDKLLELKRQNNIRILLAAESGSRAWGFPSQNSDFDVRFIYVRSLDDYLSVNQPGNVIETPIEEDEYLGVPFDLNGWDLRKALQLALKSNAVVLEWLLSPLRYMGSDKAVLEILNFAKGNSCNLSLEYHYDRLARHAWTQVNEDPRKVKVKLYCYALRPALALSWLRHFQEIPPMDIYTLCDRLPLEAGLLKVISKLVEIKATCLERDTISRDALLDHYIGGVLAVRAPKSISLSPSEEKIKLANQLVGKFIL